VVIADKAITRSADGNTLVQKPHIYVGYVVKGDAEGSGSIKVVGEMTYGGGKPPRFETDPAKISAPANGLRSKG
jgi:hypothetical protein